MKLKQTTMMALLIMVAGCNPFHARQGQTEQAMADAKSKAQKINRAYKPDIRKVKPYEVYTYESALTDPFRLRKFLIQEASPPPTPGGDETPKCLPPRCVPPTPHAKEMLESYSLNELRYVGTLDNSQALIETPDYGVVKAGLGNYMGFNNGKIIAIKETSLVLQEKLYKNGLWENKKTVLMITR